jgi:hypothetical protein
VWLRSIDVGSVGFGRTQSIPALAWIACCMHYVDMVDDFLGRLGGAVLVGVACA